MVQTPQPLSGLDAAFVYFDCPDAPLHVAQVCVFDPSTSAEGYSFDRMRGVLAARIGRLPPFRRRLVETPLGLGRPQWVEDPEFDLDRHLASASLPAPGGLDELARFSEEFIRWPLDRSRPLWEMQIVEGLEGGMVAAVTKVHHAAIDGVSGAELTASLLDLEPRPPPDPPPGRTAVEPVPSAASLLRRAGASWLREPAAASRALVAAAGAARRVRRLNRMSTGPPPPRPFAAPPTPFNAAVGPSRHVGFAHLDLEEIAPVREQTGATVNDIALATCAGAVRSYLDDIDKLPDRDLVAVVPVSVRSEDLRGTMGNRLSGMLVGLATTIEDPGERLAAIVQASLRAKRQDRTIGTHTMADLADALPPVVGPWFGRVANALQLLRRPRPLFNVIVSSFPGPGFPLYFAGARLVAPYPIGPLLNGAALNITLQSYLGGLHVGIVSDPDAVTHSDRLPGLLQDAFSELVKPRR